MPWQVCHNFVSDTRHQKPVAIAHRFLSSFSSARAAEELHHLNQSLALHDKHLGSVSAALASCFALACWNGRRARVLFITVLFGKTQWKKCLCLCGLDTADPINTLSRDMKVTPISHRDHDFAQQRQRRHTVFTVEAISTSDTVTQINFDNHYNLNMKPVISWPECVAHTHLCF